MSIPVPTFGHTPLVGGNFENGYDEATTDIKGRSWDVALRKRFSSVATALWAVCPRLTEPRLQQQSSRGNFAFSLIPQIISELRLFLPVGISEPEYLIHLCLLNHCRSG
jgi:hypothetical protein